MVLRLAHEIRNPLATIKSAIQLLEHLQRPRGEVAEYYDSIQAEVARIDRVVRDMQVFVRLDPQTASQARIEEVVSAAVEAQTSSARGRSSLLRNGGGPHATVLVDRAQLEHAVRELIDNAVRFSPPSSEIHVRWRLLEPSQVAIEVEDHGPGVSPDLVDRIMRPFFSTSTQGTGLGLNIVARTAVIAGGELRWSNLAEGGARFSLVLPRL
jgi:signal transduction histidine kinase